MNRFRWGFTIVELLVIITIMGILIGLSVIAIDGSQVSSRDAERKMDVESIAIHLESIYNTGSPALGPHYPGTSFINTLDEGGGADPRVLRAPGVDDTQPMSLIPATNGIETTAGVLPKPTVDTYVYQPISPSGDLCVNESCRRFNVYYTLEADSTVYKIESKRQ